jgi:hypothetical protein
LGLWGRIKIMRPNIWLITVSLAWTVAMSGALLAMIVMY